MYDTSSIAESVHSSTIIVGGSSTTVVLVFLYQLKDANTLTFVSNPTRLMSWWMNTASKNTEWSEAQVTCILCYNFNPIQLPCWEMISGQVINSRWREVAKQQKRNQWYHEQKCSRITQYSRKQFERSQKASQSHLHFKKKFKHKIFFRIDLFVSASKF